MDHKKNITVLYLCSAILFIVGTTSCDDNTNRISQSLFPTIHIEKELLTNIKVINLSDYFNHVEYIALEIDSIALIGNIRNKNLIDVSNRYILLSDGNVIFLFDRTGKFKNTIGNKGNGPHEYLYIHDVGFENEQSDIYIRTWKKTLYFHSDGTFKYQKNDLATEDSIKMYWKRDLDENLTVRSGFTINDEKMFFHIIGTDSSNQTLFAHTIPDNYIKRIGTPAVGNSEIPIAYLFENSIRFYSSAHDSIYYLDQEMKSKVLITIDYGNYRPSSDFVESFRGEKPYCFLNALLEVEKAFIFTFNFGTIAPERFEVDYVDPDGNIRKRPNSIVIGLYDKVKRHFVLLKQPFPKQIGFNDDIENGVPFFPTRVAFSKDLISLISVEELADLNNPSIPSVDKLEECTPVIVIVKAK